MRVGRDPDLFTGVIEIIGHQEIAILAHRGNDLLLDHPPQVGVEVGVRVAACGIVERRAGRRRGEQCVDLPERDLDVVAGRGVAPVQPFPMIRHLRRDVGGHGAPARQRLASRFLGAHALQRRERRDGGQPAAARMRHAPQLEAADPRRHGALDGVAHDAVCHGFGPAFEPSWIDATEL